MLGDRDGLAVVHIPAAGAAELCVILIPRIGIEGAALATSTALVAESIMFYRVAKQRLGFHLFILGGRPG